jgi:predicted signal transduction protein with EAL and GGDEF domain
VVGFATPFDSSSGRRVFSSAFAVAKTPLGAYMSHLVALPGRRVYLIDAHDNLLAASNVIPSAGTLGQVLAVLPDTDGQSAVVVAERLRADIAGLTSRADLRHSITVTIGVAAWTSGAMDDLIKRADAALYAGKLSGRNTVESLAQEPKPQTPA